MLFRQLDKIKRNVIMTTIVLIFAGNVLLLIPESYMTFLSGALAFVLMVGLVISLLNFIASSRALIHYIYLSLGLLGGICGMMLFLFDDLLVAVLSWLVGVIPILAGVYGIYHALTFARRSGRRGWWILIVLSCCLLAFGGLIFWNPWMESTQAVIQVIGGTLMFSAIVSILRLIWLWPVRDNGGEE